MGGVLFVPLESLEPVTLHNNFKEKEDELIIERNETTRKFVLSGKTVISNLSRLYHESGYLFIFYSFTKNVHDQILYLKSLAEKYLNSADFPFILAVAGFNIIINQKTREIYSAFVEFNKSSLFAITVERENTLNVIEFCETILHTLKLTSLSYKVLTTFEFENVLPGNTRYYLINHAFSRYISHDRGPSYKLANEHQSLASVTNSLLDPTEPSYCSVEIQGKNYKIKTFPNDIIQTLILRLILENPEISYQDLVLSANGKSLSDDEPITSRINTIVGSYRPARDSTFTISDRFNSAENLKKARLEAAARNSQPTISNSNVFRRDPTKHIQPGEEFAIGMGGVSGRYQEQQDRANVNKINTSELNSLSDPVILSILEKAVLELAQECLRQPADSNVLRSGSTLVCSLIIGNRIFVVNVGDSSCFVYENEILTPLTWSHRVIEPSENKRIRALGGTIVTQKPPAPYLPIPYLFDPKTNLRLALSRALGNKDIAGLSYDPSLTIHTTCNPGYCIICSDGITDVLTSSEIKFIIQKNILQDTSIIADAIIGAAYSRNPERGDNLSVIVASTQTSQPLLCLVADGHGSSYISTYIANRFPEIVKKCFVDHLKLRPLNNSTSAASIVISGNSPVFQTTSSKPAESTLASATTNTHSLAM